MKRFAIPAFLGALAVATGSRAEEPGPSPSLLADAYLESFGQFNALEARLWGVATPLDTLMGDNSMEAHAGWIAQQHGWLEAASRIETSSLTGPERAILFNLRGKLESAIALEACRPELWPLNSFAGWHLNLINSLGVATENAGTELNKAVLQDWAQDILDYIAIEEENLEAGLAAGYSSPRSIALQVATQLDTMATPEGDLWRVADDLPDGLREEWHKLVQTRLAPGFAGHARYIRDAYAPRARVARSLSSLPDGRACYAANILHHTGIRLTGDELLSISANLAETSEQHLSTLGQALWRMSDPAAIRSRLGETPDTALDTEADVIAAAQSDSDRLIALSARLFPDLPPHHARMAVFPEAQRSSVIASYRPDFGNGFAGVYSLNPDDPRMRTARSSESVTSHEIAPGHHMQAMVGFNSGALGGDFVHPILTVGMNNAFVEGWAQYAEILAVEEGLLNHPESGLKYWSNFGAVINIEVNFNMGDVNETETARRVLQLRGLPTDDLSAADRQLDWMSVMPAQLITYDLGADFIYRLRDRARSELGDDFDYPTFHRLILEEGSVPLWRLEEKIDAWVTGNH